MSVRTLLDGRATSGGRMIIGSDVRDCYTWTVKRPGKEMKTMRNEFTAIIERDGEWFIAYCPEIPGANGQGHDIPETLHSLAEAISLILEDRRDDALRGLPQEAIREVVVVQ